MSKMPVIFISHGAPTIAVDPAKGKELRAWAESMPEPHAILIISAHWETAGLMLGGLSPEKLIYDFGGFPAELYQIQYPAPGAPELANRIKILFQPGGESPIQQTDREWDHGVWTPLVHMYPDANIPVLQLSLPIEFTAQQLFNLGVALAPLRDEGILIIGSGQITHNLRQLNANQDATVPQWAKDFDTWCKTIVAAKNWNTLIDYQKKAPELRNNHPTEEHFRPLLVIAGVASKDVEIVLFPIEGFEYGSMSRRCIQFS